MHCAAATRLADWITARMCSGFTFKMEGDCILMWSNPRTKRCIYRVCCLAGVKVLKWIHCISCMHNVICKQFLTLLFLICGQLSLGHSHSFSHKDFVFGSAVILIACQQEIYSDSKW